MKRKYNHRITICEHTKKEIIQIWLDDRKEWLCLHNENDKLDAKKVKEFKSNTKL